MQKILMIAIVWVSCKKEKEETVKPSYLATQIPADINKLFEFKGDLDSDTVWIYVQGGPETMREYAPEDKYEDGSPVYPYFQDDLRIYPFQTQHLNSKIAQDESFTFEQAKIESSLTAEIVKNIVQHFNSKNRTVYLIGHSFGSLVVNEVLAKYGSIARKTISLNGRLNMDEAVWKGFAEGKELLFDENGLNPTLNEEADNTVKDKNMRRLAAGLGFNRYIQNLAKPDLSNTIFISATNDPYVGAFTKEEYDFALSNAEEMLYVEGGHSDVFNPETFKLLHDLIIMDN